MLTNDQRALNGLLVAWPFTARAHRAGRRVRALNHVEVLDVIERHVDEAQRRVLRCTTDRASTLPRFKKKAEQSQDERVLDILVAVLSELHGGMLMPDRLRTETYDRIDGPCLIAKDKRDRRANRFSNTIHGGSI
jgi:hypothetical protein